MQKVAIISFTRSSTDPRILRQIEAISGHVDLTVIGLGSRPRNLGLKDSFHSLTITSEQESSLSLLSRAERLFLLVSRKYEAYYSKLAHTSTIKELLSKSNYDIVLANDFETLPAALGNPRTLSRVFLDAHEYALDEHGNLIDRLLYSNYVSKWLVGRHIREVWRMSTVSLEISSEYASSLGIAEPVVIENRPPYEDLLPTRTKPERIRLVHHGSANPSRKIELMIEMMNHLDSRFDLTLMLVPANPKYLGHIKALADKTGRVKFAEPVPTMDIARKINEFDVGVYLHPPVSINDKLCLPNKFFEFIQGRLAVAIGPSPSMARITTERELGLVSSTFSPKDLARELNAVSSEQIELFKQKSHSSAFELSSNADLQAIRDSLLRDTHEG